MKQQHPAIVQTSSDAEIERLTTLVDALQAECERLRSELAVAEEERRLYRTAYHDSVRAEMLREFGDDLDISTLEKMSGGLVETI